MKLKPEYAEGPEVALQFDALVRKYDDHGEKQDRPDGAAQRASSGGHQAR